MTDISAVCAHLMMRRRECGSCENHLTRVSPRTMHLPSRHDLHEKIGRQT